MIDVAQSEGEGTISYGNSTKDWDRPLLCRRRFSRSGKCAVDIGRGGMSLKPWTRHVSGGFALYLNINLLQSQG